MRWILGWVWLNISMILGSCGQPSVTVAESSIAPRANPGVAQSVHWAGQFSGNDWLVQWGLRDKGAWGLQNMTILPAVKGKFAHILRVRYPAGSASPAVTRKMGAAVGGAQFYANLNIAPQNALRLSYYVRFPENFDFVKGGKLPGLFGGKGNSGGDIPNGSDGFSTRFMWRRNGLGEVYAYLPTSQKFGTSIGRGKWRFRRGVWHRIEQEVLLNQPNQQNGRIRVWFDGNQVLEETGLTFRRVENLKLDGLFFSTFFGGNDPSWASKRDVYVDFADFSVLATPGAVSFHAW